MKKIFTIIAVSAFVLMLGLSSCKKDYTCECTFTAPTPSLSIAIEKSSKSDAKDACSAAETTYKAGDSGVACSLK
jgi:hypothetical protein